jgi:2-polyprenyl-3-methyl-5-hydroxy-6-metoxy-1,4-benzoquinol methylase
MTFANPDVLDFYKNLPFNYGEHVDDHVKRIVGHDLVKTYPCLDGVLRPRLRVLEVGCGIGWVSCGLAYHWKCDVTAIDFNPVVIQRAQAIAERMSLAVRFEEADLFLYQCAQQAALVVSLGVLHHTNSCAEGVRRCMRDFTAPGGHVMIGLYHLYGRRPFLQHFEKMKKAGASEAKMLKEYGRLHHWIDSDKTHLNSWFRDQVLHPHETQHTLAELLEIAQACGLELVSTSINRFETIHDVSAIVATEPRYEKIGQERLAAGQYFPGFFISLFRKP